MARPITQEDLAQRCGVTRQAVSLALNNRPGVSNDLRERILAVARSLGYDSEHNRFAVGLADRRNQRTSTWNTVAVLLTDSDHQPMRQSPYYAALIAGIDAEAEARDQDLLLTRLRADALPRLVRARQVDGVIFLARNPELTTAVLALELRAVVVDHHHAGALAVQPDNAAGITALVKHLRGLGHRRLAYIGPPLDGHTARQRHDAFRVAAGSGAYVDVGMLGLEDGEGARAAHRLLAAPGPRPTALVCYNDRTALEALAALRARGLRVPEDISVAGFDDLPESAEAELTTIAFDRDGLGRTALALAIGAEVPEDGVAVGPVRLMVRGSTAKP